MIGIFIRNLIRPSRWLMVVALAAATGLAACALPGLENNPPAPVARSSGPTVAIYNPQNDQQVTLGAPVRVESISSDVEGVARIELLVNNTIIRQDANPSPEPNGTFVAVQPWLPAAPGLHLLQVRAYNLANVVGHSELIRIQVIAPTLAAPAQPGLTPSPTVEVSSTGTPTQGPSCTPPACNTGEVYHCEGDCPGGCGTQCVTPTPSPSPEPGLTPVDLPTSGLSIDDIIVDNRSPEFKTSGAWFIGDGGQSYQGDCAWAPRGIANNAFWIPTLPAAGLYEVFAWWCGDPNHDQSDRANFLVETATGGQTVQVNLRQNAGQWNSLGRYLFKAGDAGLVNVNGGYQGNVIADAVKFVYVGPEPLPTLVPTPWPPAGPLVTNNPPSQLQQATSGDLAVRLNLAPQPSYQYTPIINSETVSFDDCLDFPRDGCGGSRSGWRVQVEYLDQSGSLVVAYRVSEDYSLVTLEPSPELANRQRVFLSGDNGRGLFFEIDRFPLTQTWGLFARSGERFFNPALPPETFRPLELISQRYSSVRVTLPGGGALQLYGLGERAQLSGEDRLILETFSQQLLQEIP